MKKSDKKRHIIEATIQCIEENGLHSITVRDITEKADVNTASINYYFGSKDELIRKTLEETLENLFVDWEVILERRAMDFKEGLQAMLIEVLESTRRFPNLTKAHLYEPLINNQYDSPFSQRFDEFLQFLMEKKKKAQPDKTEREHHLEIIQLFSAIFFPGLLSELFEEFGHWDFTDASDQEAYVRQLVERVVTN